MTAKPQLEKWAAGFLAVVCALLILNLVLRGGARKASSRPAAAAASSGGTQARAGVGRSVDELARYDPRVHLNQLKELEDQPLPKLARNPFDYDLRATPRQQPVAASAPVPAAPAPPPPPPLKVVGYTELGGGALEAVVTDANEMYVVHDGETFAQRYRVLKISPTQVEVIDDTTRQNIRLPVPQ